MAKDWEEAGGFPKDLHRRAYQVRGMRARTASLELYREVCMTSIVKERMKLSKLYPI